MAVTVIDLVAILVMVSILIWGVFVITSLLWFVVLTSFVVTATMFFVTRNRR